MKKLLITMTGLMLIILLFISAFNGLDFGKRKIYSISQLKDKSQELDDKIEEANTEIKQNYAKSISDMQTATKRLKDAKEEYQSKIEYLNENPDIGITQIEKYKIEYLWGIIGNYAKDDGLKIDMNIEETSIKETYNINFTLTGSYLGITNFLYHIENDDELNYKVVGFKLEPTTVATTATTTKTTTSNNANKNNTSSNKTVNDEEESTTASTPANTEALRATFKVENIIINFN